jgi:hypothetical protein
MEKNLPSRFEREAFVTAAPEMLFAHLDEHDRLSSHMSNSSWMMGGGRMRTEVDAAGGKAVGSHIRLSGRVLGVPLAVDEVVTERIAPTVKVWETIGAPQLLVIGAYRMGFRIAPQDGGSRLQIFIEYSFPHPKISRLLIKMFGGFYARCARNKCCMMQSHTSKIDNLHRQLDRFR